MAGTLIRSGMLKVLEFQREFLCPKCKKAFNVEADFNQYYTITKPTKCKTDGCKSSKFTATNSAGTVWCSAMKSDSQRNS